MMSITKTARAAVTVLACANFAACAGRAPQLVAIAQAQDPSLGCPAIMAEIQGNNEKIGQLGREDGKKVTQNIAAGVAGLFIPIFWFGMDFQDASGKEGKALSQRNAYLAQLAAARCSQPQQASVTPLPPMTGSNW